MTVLMKNKSIYSVQNCQEKKPHTHTELQHTGLKRPAFVKDGYSSLYKMRIATNVLHSSRTNNAMPKAIKLLKNLSCPANG